MKPVQFHWRQSGELDYGFIAQDFYKVFPELLSQDDLRNGEEPIDCLGNPVYYSMEYAKITSILCKGIQELAAELDLLRG